VFSRYIRLVCAFNLTCLIGKLLGSKNQLPIVKLESHFKSKLWNMYI